MAQTLTIDALGQKGEGIAAFEGKRIFVPLALPDETVTVEIEGDRAQLVAIDKASPHRITPCCPYFGVCGGCQLQHLDTKSYREFKTGLIETPLSFAGIEARVSGFIDAGGTGRRRATLHARSEGAGYMKLKSHQVAPIDHCPILVPALKEAAPAITQAVFEAIGESDVAFTASATGIDVAVRAERRQTRPAKLAPLLARFGLARIALNGEMLLQARVPTITMGRSQVELPIGSFLQATEAAETALADYVVSAVGKSKRVADLFCGIGPFALRLAEKTPVVAHDSDKAGIIALDKAARFTSGLKAIIAKPRDLFRDPLTRFELGDIDTIVLDPPRAGAEAQCREIALSKLKTVVIISCDPKSFARDAAILIGAGFEIENLVAVDQFVWSTHIEIAATFRR